ncbi:hypothetical protein Caci_3840 [Catenulispora acidiphila DSM 44928]|uniref:Sap, sulfolipid-1-addressing protein n=1 Tax=Catenulispora acidiphila (strain DSM 44928 / JCM 14897 / NBRC 102108 / NRRL B-24433 / ID139908) TaxID=479433 RepID=C7QDE5_CATAD|nr:GAP family protein [Catenulispora acidiphila]ACU72738.1 hypothetical protein Caci_3840 [Catenulispora acidiphila DSM 44928]
MLWEAIPTALVAAFSPSMLLIVAGLLDQKRPLRNALVFLTSAAAVTLIAGFVMYALLHNTGFDDTRKHRTVPPTLDIFLGVLILLFGWFVARRPPAEPKAARQREGRLLVVVGLGLFMGSPSPFYLASIHSIAKGAPGPVLGVVDVLVIAAVVLLLAEVPIICYLYAPQRTATTLRTVNGWLARHGRAIAVAAAVVGGAYFVISGLIRLLR